ncbi:DUF2147 domain-containing protein [Enterovirga aerilata]|uniref:DUF2147 domain-containing protein n=1 Tax=Enterovirga aerilata TaxID=2730920 RepID=A0A849IHC5_9HYPH|nr:DUF2147 domain-containing protein [Enterovirga sp. DB1703]NNM73323.1 DUF2147 domain-containing protein [Enterovirga sp. DB1703]
MRAGLPVRRGVLVAAAGRDGKRRTRPEGALRLAKAIAAGGLWLGAVPALAQDVTGTWLTEGGRSQVRVAPCGTARCGTIVWTPAGAKDVNNPDPARRSNALVGLQMIRGARPTADGWTGELYNPLDGRTYTGRMRLISPAQLELSGCVLAGLICKSQIWTRLR